MDTQKQQIAERLKQAANILVTVSSNPSVDQLAACIGLTLALNKMDKHATAVFSGQIPSTLEFLQPEKTIEKTTDSLRDFIIALDKSKADKLRYKVEDKVVKIFITPYRTSITDKDLEFSQGDFNVDVVVALGVHNQADLDQAITAHGRILHDAVVATINIKPGGELGSLNWLAPQASSLSELVAQLIGLIDKSMLDGQMATSLLTGIVAETERFGNAKTSPQTMSTSAELMAAGANQQLVATKLEEARPKPAAPIPQPPPQPPTPVLAAPAKPAPGPLAQPASVPKQEGTLEIAHNKIDLSIDQTAQPAEEEQKEELTPQIDIDREGTLRRLEELQSMQAAQKAAVNPSEHISGQRMILQPPSTDGSATAQPGPDNPLSLPSPGDADMQEERPSGAPPLQPPDNFSPAGQSHTVMPPSSPFVSPVVSSVPAPAPSTAVDDALPVNQPAGAPVDATPVSHVDDARSAVHQAINAQPSSTPLPPIAALNAQRVDLNLRDTPQAPAAVFSPPPIAPGPPADPSAPPPGPPPMMPLPPQ